MILDTDQAVSEVIGTVLMVAMVVMIAGIVAAMLLGMPFIPQKPTLASFSVEIIQAPNNTQPGGQTVPVISFYQVSGDHLAFFGPNGTTVMLTDPTSTMYSVKQYGPVPGTDIQIGERFFIFKQAGSPGNFMATNNQSSIPATDAFTPHGTWRFAIVDEKETNMILFERDLSL